MTETVSVATIQPKDENRIGTIGKLVPGVEIKVAEDNELLLKTPGVFVGYYKMPEETEKALGDGSIFYNPEELDKDDLQMVLSHAWAGTPLDRGLVKKGSLQIK